MTLIQFCDALNLILSVAYSPNAGDKAWRIEIKNVYEITTDGSVTSCSPIRADAQSLHSALSDYVELIKGQTILISTKDLANRLKEQRYIVPSYLIAFDDGCAL